MMALHKESRSKAAERGYLKVAPLAKWWSKDNEDTARAELDKLFESHAREIADSLAAWYER